MKQRYFILFIASLTILLFQNCSNWKGDLRVYSVENLATTLPPTQPEVLPSGEPKAEKTSRFYEVSMDQRTSFPPLKMVFVVDNSYTMSKAHQTLSKSFENMFAGTNAKNLTPFDTTIYLINTAQKNLPSYDTIYDRVPTLDMNKINSGSYNVVDLQVDRAENLSGKIAGDIIGFSKVDKLAVQDPTKLYTRFDEYFAAPILSVSASGSTIEASAAIHKLANEPASELVDSFLSKLELMSPNRSLGQYSQTTTIRSGITTTVKNGEFNAILDKESALCAISRMFRNSDSYFKPGDVASLVVISDEDDNDPSGLHCIQSEKSWNEVVATKTTVIPSRCERQLYVTTGSISYTSSTAATSSKCAAKYYSGYTAQLYGNTYTTTATYFLKDVKYRTSYVTQGSTAVTVPAWSFHTTISYWTKNSDQQTCISNDGIETCSLNSSEFTSHSSVISGTFPQSQCSSHATALDATALVDNNHLPSCTAGSTALAPVIVSYNVYNNPLTIATISLTAATMVTGQPDCKDYVSKIPKVVPNLTPQCDALTPTYTAYSKTLTGKLEVMCPDASVTSATTFLTQKGAPSISGYTLDSGYQPSCTTGTITNGTLGSYFVSYASNTYALPALDPNLVSSGTNLLISGGDPLTVGTIANVIKSLSPTLSADITSATYLPTKVKIIHNSIVTSSFVANLDSGSCTPTAATQLVTNISGAAFVSAVYTQATSANSNTILLGIKFTSPSFGASLNCDTPCSQVTKINGTAFCSAGYTNSSVKNYLNSLTGADNNSCVPPSTLVTTPTVTITKGPINVQPTESFSCNSNEGHSVQEPAQEIVVSNATISHLDTEFVSGTQLDATEQSQIPKTDLTQYILNRSAVVLGAENKPTIILFKKPSSVTNQKVNYENLVTTLGGQVEDLTIEDYSPALEKLSDLISEKIGRSVVIDDLDPDGTVVYVWRLKDDGTWSDSLPQDQWSQSGKTVIFDKSVKINPTDKFRFEYK
jgi:hypothetical protein